MSEYRKTLAQHQDVERVKTTEERLNDLEQRAYRLPVLNDDPPVGSPINTWLLYDGRLRTRVGGVVREYAQTAAGPATSTVLKPVTSASLQQYVETFDPTWQASYGSDGLPASSEHVWYGRANTTVGERRSLVGYNAAAISAALVGATVQRVELLVTNYTANVGAVPVAIAASAALSAPATWSDLLLPTNGPAVLRAAQGASEWRQIDLWFGVALKAGRIGALGFDQSMIGSGLGGYFSGIADLAGPPPSLRIIYTV